MKYTPARVKPNINVLVQIIEQDKESGTLFLVIEGSVRIEKTTSDGNSIRLAVMGAGTLLGDSSVLPGTCNFHRVRVLY